MAQYRALLIGASDYEMRGVPALPFIPGDLARLGAALRGGGFDDVQVLAGREGGKQVSANYVNARVTGFLRRARENDTLFILLSGHGVHAKGQDYLVPEDIDEDTHPFESGCVAIDWREHLDETPARHVVFLIDACREGVEQESMGVASVRQWSKHKVDAALRRKVAYVYACSPAQLALFVRTHDALVDYVAGIRPGESFSLFSRSVSDVITAHHGSAALTLAEFKDAVQERMTRLHRAYRKHGQPQTLRIITDIALDSFAFLPPPSALPGPARQPLFTRERTGKTTYEGTAMNVGVPVPTQPPHRIRRSPGQGSRPPGGPTRPTATSTAAVSHKDTALDSAPVRAGGDPSPSRVLRDLKRSNKKLDRAMRGLNRPARWARIAVLISTGAAVITGTGYALWASRPDGNQRTDNSSGPSASAQISSQHTTPPPRRDTVPDLGNQSVNTAAIMRLPRCTDSDSLEPVTLQLRSERNSYDSTDTPVLIFKIKSTTTCRINATPKLVTLTITRADEDKPLWSSASCSTETPDRWLSVSASTPATVTYRWNLHRNTSCSEARKAPTGTYLATGDFGSLFVSDAQTSFVVTTD
ncbi:caspase family protein [Streptomyces bicolor]|uniref:caspase family protein n=1 Tax=Streptomyces bicolor TaxID=66874 RepID=UPI0004E25EFE|nr:caspase family protein [Streptomyces bicolor]